MRLLFCLVLGAMAAARPAAAEGPESIANLIGILAPEPGSKGCYRRVYDKAHLAAHPKQTVTAMTFLIRVVRYDAQGERHHTPATKPDDWIGYQFAMAIDRRQERRTRRTAGDCFGNESARCSVDCDGGGVTLEKAAPDGLLVRLADDYGIRLSGACEGKAVMLKPGTDDKAFRLAKVADKLCAALEKDQLGD